MQAFFNMPGTDIGLGRATAVPGGSGQCGLAARNYVEKIDTEIVGLRCDSRYNRRLFYY